MIDWKFKSTIPKNKWLWKNSEIIEVYLEDHHCRVGNNVIRWGGMNE